MARSMPAPSTPGDSPLTDFRYFATRETYLAWLGSGQYQAPRRALEVAVAARLANGERLRFYCHAHSAEGTLVHSASARSEHGYHWREAGACDVCGAITRIRLAAEWFASAAAISAAPRVYITEQLTPLYKVLRHNFPDLVGSEYVPDTVARIKSSEMLAMYTADVGARIRHEDVCNLSFADESFDLIGSFDVLEHVPDYHAALREFHRVLAPGGQLLLTAPFLDGAQATLTRARIVDGEVRHIEPPEYHGNPTLPEEGSLCFYHFGWDLLDALRNIGFSSVALLSAWGEDTAIFGAQNAIVATK